MARDLGNSLEATLVHYRAPLFIAAIGAALSILAFLTALSAQIDRQRREFVRFADVQAQVLANQFHYAGRQLRQLAAYAEAVDDMDAARFEVFARELLSEVGLSYAGWMGEDGTAYGMWQGTSRALESRHAQTLELAGLEPAPPSATATHGREIALARIVAPGSARVAQLAALLPVQRGGSPVGRVVGRIDIDGVVTATAGHDSSLPWVVQILDADNASVFHSERDRGAGGDGNFDALAARNAGYYVQRNLQLFDRDWRIAIFPPATFLIGETGTFPWLVLLFSLAMTVLIGLIAFQQAHQTLTVRERVTDQTSAIRSMAENAVRTEARLQAIFDTSVDGLITIDQQGIVENYNPACERLFGYAAEEVLGRNICMLMPEPLRSAHDGYLANYLRTGEAKIIGIGREVRAQRKDGTTFPMELAVAEMRDGGRRRYSGVIRDITERHNLLEGLRASNEELERFAYVASHDLKAPLRAIDNLSQWIQEDLGDVLEGETREHMVLLRSRVARMDRLLDDLLEYSRVGRKDADGTFDVVTAREVVDDVLLLIEPPPGFVLEIGEGLAHAEVNRMPLQQVLINLLSNAIKHHDRADGRITVEVARDAGQYRFEVGDDGPGIDQAHHGRIFEMFQTLQPRDSVEGSGMGLALVKKLVEQQGGTIRVESTPGHGARFCFSWPQSLRRAGEESHAA